MRAVLVEPQLREQAHDLDGAERHGDDPAAGTEQSGSASE